MKNLLLGVVYLLIDWILSNPDTSLSNLLEELRKFRIYICENFDS